MSQAAQPTDTTLRHWLLMVCAAVSIVVLAGSSRIAAEEADSGWVVARPDALSDEDSRVDEKPEIVFGDANKSVEASSEQQPQAKPSDSSSPSPRVAARSVRSSGWRPTRDTRNGSAQETGPAPPQPTETTPSFLLPTTPVEREGEKSSKPQAKSAEASSEEPASESTAKETGRQQPAVEVTDESADAGESADTESEVVEIVDGDEPETTEPLPSLTKEMVYLRSKLRRVLKAYYRRPLNSRDNDPWEVMHGMLAFGIHSRVQRGGPRGEPITAVGWLCYNKPCKWTTLMYVSPEGKLRAKYGVSLQGHMGQFLAMLAQCGVSTDYPVRAENHEFTVQDLIQAEMDTCYSKTELTFKLIALTHYLDSDATWINDKGQDWSISRLIHEEMAQPIRGAACGGTHRLAGLSLAARTRVERGEPLDGEFARAAEYVKKYHEYAFRFQNRDGSLSTSWFRGRGDEQDLDRRVKTTGHTLEWLCYSLDDDEMTDWRTFRAVNYLTSILYGNYNHEWEVGPLCHALHALILYDERVFQPYDEKLDVASRGNRKSASRNRSMPAWMR